MLFMLCHACQKTTPLQDKAGFRAECPHCSADLHVCKNCEFYDASVYNECRETSAERITQKDKANFCEYFVAQSEQTAAKIKNATDDAKQKLEALFKKNEN